MQFLKLRIIGKISQILDNIDFFDWCFLCLCCSMWLMSVHCMAGEASLKCLELGSAILVVAFTVYVLQVSINVGDLQPGKHVDCCCQVSV